MAIIRQIPWTEQPQDAFELQPEIATHLSVLALGSRPDFLGCGAVTEAGGITRSPSRAGMAWQGDGTDNIAFATPVRDGSIQATGAHFFTLITVFRKRAAGASTGHIAGYGSSGGGSGNTLHRLVGGSTADQIQLQLQTSGGNLLYNTPSSSANIDDQGWHCAVVPYRSTTTAADDAAVYFIDGVQRGSVARTAGTQDTTFNRASVGAGLRAGAAISPGNFDVALYVHLLTRMPDAWCAQASQLGAVWDAVFRPRTERIWVPASSGGAYSITAHPGSYALAGQASTITRSRLLSGSAGSYAVTGQSATVSRSRLITASAGAYSIAGQSATLVRSRLITAQAGAYTYTGQSATISYTASGAYTLTALAGSYALSGQSATLTKSRVINASAGSYALTGKVALITYSGAPAPTSLSGVYFDVLSGRLLVLRART